LWSLGVALWARGITLWSLGVALNLGVAGGVALTGGTVVTKSAYPPPGAELIVQLFLRDVEASLRGEIGQVALVRLHRLL
jgi:hypothetical protein